MANSYDDYCSSNYDESDIDIYFDTRNGDVSVHYDKYGNIKWADVTKCGEWFSYVEDEIEDFKALMNSWKIDLEYELYEQGYRRCPVCDRLVLREDMTDTYDCHGIFMRRVCDDCYSKIMEEKGYDGEYYTELDECIDYDY